MTFEQAKVFCCEEILKNISEFGERHELTSDILNLSDKIMKEKVMPYLALKYPLNESTNMNRSLSKIVKEIDNNEVLSNDFFYNSDIVVDYRSNGNYNDFIMRVLNEVISVADAPSTSSTRSKETSNLLEFE